MQIAGRYEIEAEVARGGQGLVVRARDPHGARHAIKIATATSTAERAALLAEHEALARMVHRALPRVTDVGTLDRALGDLAVGAPYVAFEWVEGTPIDRLAVDAAGAARVAWEVAADVAGALAVIHAAGLLHRDVSPANVIVRPAQAGPPRAVLIDLGLAGAGGAARGTPGYLAPEALAGDADPRSDVFALGATLWRLAAGRPPFPGPSLAAIVRATLEADLAPPPHVPPALADLVRRMTARSPAARPPNALAVLDELEAIGGALDPPPPPIERPRLLPPQRPLPLCGRDAALAALEAALRTPGRAVRVVGLPGAGVDRVLAEAVRRHLVDELATASAARGVVHGDVAAVAARLGVPPRLPEVIAAASRWPAPVVVALPDAEALAGAVAALEPPRAAVLLCAELTALPAPVPGLDDIALDRIGADELGALVTELVGRPPPAAWLTALDQRAGGMPAIAAELLATAAAGGDPYAADPRRLVAGSAITAALARLADVPAGARAIAEGLAVWGGSATADAAIATGAAAPADLGALAAAGLVALDRARAALGPGLAAAIAATLAPARAKELAIRGAAWCEATGAEPIAHARLVAQLPPAPARAAVLVAAATAVLAAEPADALRFARAAAAEPGHRAVAGDLAARAALAAGSYAEAIALAEAAGAHGAPPRAVALTIARAAQRLGDLPRAIAALEVIATDGDDEVIGTLARLLLATGELARARALAGAGGRDHAGAARTEAAGLAAYYAGDVEAADALFARLEAGAAAAADRRTVGRALSLRGMVAQRRGDLVAASDRYARAADAMREVGDPHAAAVAELNLGTALAERGRFAEALPALTAAARRLTALGARAETAAAEFNRGNSLLGLGQPDDAALAAARVGDRADAPTMAAFGRLLAGDVCRRQGDDVGARAAYGDGLARARDGGGAEAVLAALLALAEVGGADAAAWAEAEALAENADDRDRLWLSRARDAIRRGATGAEARALAHEAAGVADRARAADRLDRAWRGHALAAVLATRSGDDGRPAGRAAIELHDRLIAAAAPAWRAGMLADPERAAVAELAAPAPATPVETGDVGELRRLLALSRRLNSETSLDRLLDEVIDTAIELTAAERGFLLLYPTAGGPDAALAPVVARNFGAADLVEPGTSLSRSIAERAARTGEPVITVDAGVDERFGGAASVAALRLRSVMAVPLRQKGRVIGCLYVDHRLRGGAFDDRAATRLLDLGDLAAIAIENARLADDLRRRTAEVDRLNQRLAADLEERDVELARVKAALPADRDRLRHPYAGIVGRSPAIVAMLQVVDRAAESSLPVVIVGESGTGKELVARALHDSGPRRDRSFVAVNCSAVPEPLLESELFGHVRGAFTGADRDRRGLFEVADGGTLFLDEVADTGPAMQAKLLRVLQDGVIRRVGDHRTRQVDARIVAATQRPLAELVAGGRFREDLRYRLDVLSITVPPLRAREADLPLLVAHLLGKLAPDRPPRLTRAAERALAAHRWPGNIRELENALARAIALGGEVIDVHDLPEAVAATAPRSPSTAAAPDHDLRLRPAIEATERAYLAAALDRAHNNQTVAARLLGLSRFGLQKKLKRLEASGADIEDDD